MSVSGQRPDSEPQRQRVLLVDDEPAVAKIVWSALADYGLELILATGGDRALRLARRATPDLILLDLRMPGMDGLEVCRRLKSDPATDAIPVIFFSGCDALDEKLEAFRLGALDYITKPVDQRELLARVILQLGQRMRLECLQRRLEIGELRAATAAGPAADASEAEPPASPSAEHTLPKERVRRLRQAREQLETCLSTTPTLDDLANLVGLSRKRLSTDFQTLYGMTVFEWLREQRMRRAAELLLTTDLPVAVIADRVGMGSAAYFATAFKQRFALTPRQFRLSATLA